MIVVRFKVTCRADTIEDVAAAMKAVVEPSRDLPGVLHFDVARDLVDAQALIATEVFADREAMDRQETLPEVAAVLALLEGGAAAAEPEWTVYDATPLAMPA